MVRVNVIPPQITAQDVERFRRYVNTAEGQGPNGDCWEWQGCKFQSKKPSPKYGMFVTRDGRKCRNVHAHRAAVFIETGEWPTLNVLHRCDNPPCVRPDHLFLGTLADNNKDRKQKGRSGATRGVNQRAAKLNDEKVRAIREIYATGTSSHSILARQYGVTPRVIQYVVKRIHWKHVI